MRRILVGAAVLLAVGAFLVLTLGASGGTSSPTYNIELDNAFGLTAGADFKVAGVTSGSIKSINLCYTRPPRRTARTRCMRWSGSRPTLEGFGQFH